MSNNLQKKLKNFCILTTRELMQTISKT